MTSFRSDPLLGLARGILIFSMVLAVIAAAGFLIGAGVIVAMYPAVTGWLAEHAAPALSFWAILAIALLAAGVFVLIYRFANLLRRIVDTVGDGDPFIPDNADRLNHMAWLVIGVQALSIPIGALGAWLAMHIKDAQIDIDAGLDINGVLLAVVLFILARVFRRGADMREELEGTV